MDMPYNQRYGFLRRNSNLPDLADKINRGILCVLYSLCGDIINVRVKQARKKYDFVENKETKT